MSIQARFANINKAADYIMDQLYDGPSQNPWVVIMDEDNRFGVNYENTAMEEGLPYFRITWDQDGQRILEGEV